MPPVPPVPSVQLRRITNWRLACASLCFLLLAMFALFESHAYAQVGADRIATLDADQQVAWLTGAAASGELAALDDEQLVTLFQSLDPHTLPRYLSAGTHRFASCEFTMWRRERVKGKWPKRADHMLVRVTREPLRIYAKWLPDGAHAGQEIIYDDSTRPRELYGHLGGLFGVVPMWTKIDGAFARAQSNHSIRELSIDAITQRFIDESRRFIEAGITRPASVDVRTIDGVRVVALTYDTPSGQPDFYAKREVLGLDLTRPLLRSIESFDNDGEQFESIVLERIDPKPFDDLTFDPKNPDYRF
ncbi:DUF1571 domain-containing protein [Caballeronia sp. LZ001]|uniref:DUF1571 domain-containing protein n=1 Tax=Caballeronia sp. LZ001 TaxID=3038553 RepID=UPI0028647C57|nr:DUF1571 domain-containing protein [Caballeronia sp. LZ001]MDR5804713.1 DUF1571 domain-containing protein [Caballeronia sp. LZ001]